MKIKILGVTTRVGDTTDGPRYVHDVVLEVVPNDAPLELAPGDELEVVKFVGSEIVLQASGDAPSADPE